MSEASSFTEGWEAMLGLEPCDDAAPEWLPPDWNMAVAYNGGKKRKRYVSPDWKICQDRADAFRFLGLAPEEPRQPEVLLPFNFADGWEEKLGLERFNDELPPGLPLDWKMARRFDIGKPSGRRVFVSPAGKVIREKCQVESILGFTFGECGGPRSGVLVPFDFTPGWEETMGLEPMEGVQAGLPLGWKMARRTNRRVYVTPEGKVIREKTTVESMLGIKLGEIDKSSSSCQHGIDQEATTASASANGSQPDEGREIPGVMITHGSAHVTGAASSHSMDHEATTAAASATASQPVELPRVEEIELPSVMISHGFFASFAKSTEELRRQIRLLEDEQAERLLEFLGDDVVATDEGHCVVDLDVLLKPRLIALRDFVARQLSTSAAKRTRVV